ncbi:MAG: CoA ester lyase [Chloroflexi bacterium]|nr:CoA ester lyase [Chloroflexota bacterium]
MMPVLRSLLFVPGIRPTMIDRARNLMPDAIVLDLEDSVPVPEKEQARAIVRDALPTLVQPGRLTLVRINGFHTGLAELDLAAIVQPGLDGISLPKPTGAETILRADAILTLLERQQGMAVGTVRIIPWIETALSLVRAFEIASASPRVLGISFGAEDFTLDMGITRTLEGEEVAYAQAMLPIAARAANVQAIHGTYMAFQDQEGLVREAQQAKRLGYQGKFLIHPSQIDPVNQVFRPTEEEVAYARRVIEAFEAAAVQGHGAVSLEGHVVDVPVYDRARNLLAWAEALAERQA